MKKLFILAALFPAFVMSAESTSTLVFSGNRSDRNVDLSTANGTEISVVSTEAESKASEQSRTITVSNSKGTTTIDMNDKGSTVTNSSGDTLTTKRSKSLNGSEEISTSNGKTYNISKTETSLGNGTTQTTYTGSNNNDLTVTRGQQLLETTNSVNGNQNTIKVADEDNRIALTVTTSKGYDSGTGTVTQNNNGRTFTSDKATTTLQPTKNSENEDEKLTVTRTSYAAPTFTAPTITPSTSSSQGSSSPPTSSSSSSKGITAPASGSKVAAAPTIPSTVVFTTNGGGQYNNYDRNKTLSTSNGADISTSREDGSGNLTVTDSKGSTTYDVTGSNLPPAKSGNVSVSRTSKGGASQSTIEGPNSNNLTVLRAPGMVQTTNSVNGNQNTIAINQDTEYNPDTKGYGVVTVTTPKGTTTNEITATGTIDSTVTVGDSRADITVTEGKSYENTTDKVTVTRVAK